MRMNVLSASRLLVVPLALGLLAPARVDAQATGVVSGRVVEAGGQRPLADVQVGIAGTSLGAITNAAGNFTISAVPAGQHEVQARRIGFGAQNRTVTVTGGDTVRVDFSLSTSTTQLSQVVVTGTAGAVERRTVGNSVTQVNVAELTERNTIMNVTEVLQGKSPGVTILPGSGAAGTAGEIRIRGSGSTSGYQPVVYIDGIRYNISDLGGFSATGGGTAGLAQSSQVTSALNWLNPNDIESIEILKGPAASTLYGAEAANGVIQIITKRGRRGQQDLQWGFRAERGQTEWNLAPPTNYTTCDATKIAQTVSATDPTPLWPGCHEPDVQVNDVITDNPMMRDPNALRTGDLSRLSMSLRGGGDRYSMYVSADRDVEQGVFLNNDVNRTSIRSNFSFTPSDALNFDVSVNWQDGRIRLPIQDESANGLLLSATRGLPGRRPFVGEGNEGWRTISPAAANRYRNFTNTSRLTLGGTARYTPFSWFRNTLTLGLDNTTTQAQVLFLPGEIDPSQDPDAAIGANLRRTPTADLLTLNYNGDLLWEPTASLQTTTSFGAQVNSDRRERLQAYGIGLGAPDVTQVDLAQRSTGAELYSENNSVGYYLQEQIGWRDRLFVTGAVRADDHSSFGTNFDLIVYPKLSVSYVLSDEPAATSFVQALRINSLKLRGAWGQAGRAPSAYSAVQTYTVDRVTLGGATGSAAITQAFGNPDLKPEKGEEIELGFEASAFDDRIGADFTWYDKRTTDMLQLVANAPSTGFTGSRWSNLGEVRNSGIELGLFGTPLDLPNLRWDTRLNMSTNANELVSFGLAGKTLETPGGQAYGSVQQHREGYPLGGFWVAPPLRCGVDALHANAATTGPNACAFNQGEVQLTAAGAAIFNSGDSARRYIGPSIPTREIGLSNTFTFFRHFHLYGLLDYKGGFYVFNAQERSRCQAANDNCARTNDPDVRFPETEAEMIANREFAVYRSTAVAPEWIQKGDFVKLREVSLTVDVPQRLLTRTGASTASIVFSGRNLALWTDYEGTDPEVNSYGGRNFVRVDAYAAPMLRRFTAAINLTF
jgi:TonB-linked SusC/RagA family outer membrane protein